MFRSRKLNRNKFLAFADTNTFNNVASERIKEKLIEDNTNIGSHSISRLKKLPYTQADLNRFKQSFMESKNQIFQQKTNQDVQKVKMFETSQYKSVEQASQTNMEEPDFNLEGLSSVLKVQMLKNIALNKIFLDPPHCKSFKKTEHNQHLRVIIVNIQTDTIHIEDKLHIVDGHIQINDGLNLQTYLTQLKFIQRSAIYLFNIGIYEQDKYTDQIYQCVVSDILEPQTIETSYIDFVLRLQNDQIVKLIIKDQVLPTLLNSFMLVWDPAKDKHWVHQLQFQNNIRPQKTSFCEGKFTLNSKHTIHNFENVVETPRQDNNENKFISVQQPRPTRVQMKNYSLSYGVGTNNFSEQRQSFYHSNDITNLSKVLSFLQTQNIESSNHHRINEVVVRRQQSGMRPRSKINRQKSLLPQTSSSKFKGEKSLIQLQYQHLNEKQSEGGQLQEGQQMTYLQRQQFSLIHKNYEEQLRQYNVVENSVQQQGPKLARAQTAESRFRVPKQSYAPLRIQGSNIRLGL